MTLIYIGFLISELVELENTNNSKTLMSTPWPTVHCPFSDLGCVLKSPTSWWQTHRQILKNAAWRRGHLHLSWCWGLATRQNGTKSQVLCREFVGVCSNFEWRGSGRMHWRQQVQGLASQGNKMGPGIKEGHNANIRTIIFVSYVFR